MSTSRIYLVKDKATGQERLVLGLHASQALRHVAEASFSVAVAKTTDVARLMVGGAKVETAGEAAA